MSIYTFAFYVLTLLLTCIYLVRCGGRTGRWASAVQLSMAGVSAVVSYYAPSFAWILPRMLAVDVVSLALKSAIAFNSTRRWPIWVAGFQLNTVLAEFAIFISPRFHTDFYHSLATIWAIPTLWVMIIGVYLDNRHDRRASRANYLDTK